MTDNRKQIVEVLLSGWYLVKWKNHRGTSCYRLYDQHGNPRTNLREKTIDNLDRRMAVPKGKKIWKRDKAGRITLNLSVVRQLHGKGWINKMYKQQQNGR